jgi:tryptophan synthase alpha chain
VSEAISRIDDIFATLRSENRRALMPFIVGGHPRRGDLSLLLPALEKPGASIIEIGIPFSDPIADGSVIAEAMHEALTLGVTPDSIFEEVASIRPWLKSGLVAMVSVSIVHRWGGPNAFAQKARQAGFDGLIVPDAPLEAVGPIREAAALEGLSLSLLLAPTTPVRRAEEILKASTGFLYLLARAGLTGEQMQAPDIASKVARLREMTSLPIACGFGISTPDHVRAVTLHADAAIVGSALVRRISAAVKSGRDPIIEAEDFTKALVDGLSVGQQQQRAQRQQAAPAATSTQPTP